MSKSKIGKVGSGILTPSPVMRPVRRNLVKSIKVSGRGLEEFFLLEYES